MPSTERDWFKQAVHSSNLPRLLSKYKPEALLAKSLSTESSFFIIHCDVLSCCFAICDTGENEEINDDEFKEIMSECHNILLKWQHTKSLPLDRLRTSRGIRPSWYSIPIYEEILKPFSNEVKFKLGYSIEDVFNFARDLSSIRGKVFTNPFEIHFPEELAFLKEDLIIKYSNVNSLGDIWNKLFIQLENGFHIFLDYKLAEVIYINICIKLENSISDFRRRKGHYLEDLVKRKVKEFIPRSDMYHKYYIENYEKDLLIDYKELGICIECKSVNIRPSSSDWSVLDLLKDIEKNVFKALNQIEDPLNLLSNGGSIRFHKKNYKIKSKTNYFGLIITDQVYTPFIRASIEDVGSIRKKPLTTKWHGENIWIGSIIDFIFLLEVSITPSILLDYFQHIRSVEALKNSDEPESWLFYCMDPIMPVMLEIPKQGISMILNGFGWDEFKEKRANYCRPIWLESEFDSIIKYDTSGLFLNSSNLIRQRRKKTSQKFTKKFKEHNFNTNDIEH